MTTATEPNLQGWIPQKPDSRDYQLLERLPLLRFATPPDSVAPLTTALPVLDQGNLGSCTAYGSGKAFRYLDRQDGSDFDVSELSQYYNSRLLMGQQYVTQDSGATIRDAVKALAQFGMARETDWPYVISKFTQTPPQAAYDFAARHQALEYVAVSNSVNEVKLAIAAGYPVIIGFTVYQNYQQGFGSGIWPEPSGAVVGGHCVLLDGYDSTHVLFPNSWGTGVGIAGRFRMSWSYLLNNGADFWILKKVEEDNPPPTPPPTPEPTPTPKPIPYAVSGIEYWKMSDGATWVMTYKFDPPA